MAQVALDDGGSWLLVEDEAARVMPSSAAVRAAGRYDLHHAIVFAGGYSAVRDCAHAPATDPKSPGFTGFRSAFLWDLGRENIELRAAGRYDLHHAIVFAGGYTAIRGSGGARPQS